MSRTSFTDTFPDFLDLEQVRGGANLDDFLDSQSECMETYRSFRLAMISAINAIEVASTDFTQMPFGLTPDIIFDLAIESAMEHISKAVAIRTDFLTQQFRLCEGGDA